MHAKTLTKIVRGSLETIGAAPSYPSPEAFSNASLSFPAFSVCRVTAVIIAIPCASRNENV